MIVLTPSFKLLSPVTMEELTPEDGVNMMKHIERCGRICYKSEGAITDNSYDKFIRGLIARGHESVLEHSFVTAIITTDRGVTHEIVRHRLASYSQESTRYCNYAKDKFGNEIQLIDIRGGMAQDQTMENLNEDDFALIFEEWCKAVRDAEQHYMNMIALGASPQIARSVLPNSTKADIVATMDIRAWRHFFKLRCAPAAHPQMREIAIPMLVEMYKLMPALFDDIYWGMYK